MTEYPKDFDYIRCLDKGFVAIIDVMGSDASIARAARVRPEAEWREKEDPKLLEFMIDNRHSTPFEKAHLSFWVKAPILTYRQWHRHRTWSYNEQSARYMVMDGEFYIPDPALIGEQSKSNHQARIISDVDERQLHERRDQVAEYQESCQRQYDLYLSLLKRGWPRELARSCLPVSLYSQMEADVNLWNLFKFLELRLDPHAQFEIRAYAEAMLDLARRHFPISVAAWEKRRSSTP